MIKLVLLVLSLTGTRAHFARYQGVLALTVVSILLTSAVASAATSSSSLVWTWQLGAGSTSNVPTLNTPSTIGSSPSAWFAGRDGRYLLTTSLENGFALYALDFETPGGAPKSSLRINTTGAPPGRLFGEALTPTGPGTNAIWVYSGVTTRFGYPGNDLWKLDLVTLKWKLLTGSPSTAAVYIYPVYAVAKGIADPRNTPGSRADCTNMIVDEGYRSPGTGAPDIRIWWYSGSSPGWPRDLWSFSDSANAWVWMSGTSVSGPPTFTGPASFIQPGSRAGHSMALDTQTRVIYLFGGSSTHVNAPLNDLWSLDLSTLLWVYLGGNGASLTQPTASLVGPLGVGVSAPLSVNMPGSRNFASVAVDPNNGDLFIAGGTLDWAGKTPISDLWRYRASAQSMTLLSAVSPSFAYCKRGIYNASCNLLPARMQAALVMTTRGTLAIAGGYMYPIMYSDLWTINMTSTACTCDPRSACLIQSSSAGGGSAICLPYIEGGPANVTVLAGERLSFMVRSPCSPGTQCSVRSVTLGSNALGYYRFACHNLSVNAGGIHLNVSCTIPPGAGAHLLVTVTSCTPLDGCMHTRHQDFRVSYAPMRLLPGTLRRMPLTGAPGALTQALGILGGLPTRIALGARNVWTQGIASGDVKLGYSGEINNGSNNGGVSTITVSAGFTCTIDQAATTATLIVCTTQLGSTGIGLTPILSSTDAVPAIGTDTLNFLSSDADAPRLLSADPGLAIPTDAMAQGVLLTVTGEHFFEPLSALVNGATCHIIPPSSSTRFICALPNGAGIQKSVVVLSAGFISQRNDSVTVSYAAPTISALASEGCLNVSGLTDLYNCRAGAVLTIDGTNFGASGAQVFVGVGTCDRVEHDASVPHSRLRCWSTPVSGQGTVLSVQVLQQNGQLSTSEAAILEYPRCLAGTFASGPQLEFCIPCALGTFTSARGQTVCELCAQGRFSARNASVACDPCAKGRFQKTLGQSTCQACGAGRYASTTQSAECELAPAGSNATADGALFAPCPPGTYAPRDGLSQCLDCPSGQIAPRAGATACSACTLGQFAGSANVDCQACPAGTFGVYLSTASAGCTACPPGTFASATGSTVCAPCAANAVTLAQGGASACMTCPDQAHATSATACTCNTGLFWREGVCVACPSSATTCVDGLIVNPINTWVAAGVGLVLECPLGRCLANRNCSANRVAYEENPLCGQCLPGYTEMSGVCVECRTANGGYVFLVLVLAALFVGVTHKLAQNSNAWTKIALFWLQTLSTMLASSDHVFEWMSALNLSPSSSMGAVCVVPMTPYEQLGFPAMSPLLFMAILAAMAGVHAILGTQTHRRCATYWGIPTLASWYTPTETDKRSSMRAYQRTLIMLAISSFTQVATNMLLFLECVDVPTAKGGQTRVVFAVPAIDCTTDKYKAWAAIVLILFFLIVLGSLVATLGYLLYNKKAIRAAYTKEEVSAMAPLYETYRVDRTWVEPLMLSRRIAFIALAVAMGQSAVWRYAGMALVSLLCVILHFVLQPFKNVIENKLEMLQLSALMLVGIILTASPSGKHDSTANGLVLGLILLLTLLLVAYLVLEKTTPRLAADNPIRKRWEKLKTSKLFTRPDTLDIAAHAAAKLQKRKQEVVSTAQIEMTVNELYMEKAEQGMVDVSVV